MTKIGYNLVKHHLLPVVKITIAAAIFLACNKQKNTENVSLKGSSYANFESAAARSLDLKIKANFNNRTLEGTATWQVNLKDPGGRLVLDCGSMEILEVSSAGQKLKWTLSKPDSIFGSALTILSGKSGEQSISIHYRTQPENGSLLWLDSGQTLGKTKPMLFTQSQAILARHWVPCMDDPQQRFTYTATVECPKDLLALMSATNPKQKNSKGIYRFEMKQAIPSYLLALAIGDFEYKALSAACGVYSEPAMVHRAAEEFSSMPQMISSAEKLFGPYRWEQYDVLVLPPAFPFGGMENPRLTFATPTVVTGDKSLVDLVAHELAHSWSGNLVTNRSWDDFWLNEGFTVYFENRIMEELRGADYARMEAQVAVTELDHTLKRMLSEAPDDTKLKLKLGNRNPDEGLTDIAYIKGFLFLKHLENLVGRENWDPFLKGYFDHFAFKTITTEEFISYLETHLLKQKPQWSESAKIQQWVYETGLPESPVFRSERIEQADAVLNLIQKNGLAKLGPNACKNWVTQQWLHFLQHLPDNADTAFAAALDSKFHFTASQNAEIQCAWYTWGIRNGYRRVWEPAGRFMHAVGRRKFLEPVYEAWAGSPEGKQYAMQVFSTAKSGYHALAVNTIAEILK